jgi:AAA+ ATPase superfamily predicted ATPase
MQPWGFTFSIEIPLNMIPFWEELIEESKQREESRLNSILQSAIHEAIEETLEDGKLWQHQ